MRSRFLFARTIVWMTLLPPLALAQSAPDPRPIIADAQKIVSANGVDEAKAVKIGGIQQWVTVRGRDRRNPILLVVHGGPAAPDLPTRYLYESAWEDYFTVVQWDQRGGGKTYRLNDPNAIAPTLTKARIVADAEELVAYLRETYGKKKIFLFGHSWGTGVGLEVALHRPEWLYAYAGAGQIIDFKAGERAGYAWVLERAREDHNIQAVQELNAIAPYPSPGGQISVDKLGVERKWSVHYGGLTYGRSAYDYWENAEKISPDYADADFKAIDAGSAFSLPKLLPDLIATDYSKNGKADCPIVIFAGRYDYTTPSEPVRLWFDHLQAPMKKWVWFENSAHMLWAEEPGRVLVHLVEDLRPIAAKAGDVPPGE